MQASEGTPLLADPPIDDDSYRHEARAFPSDEQKQLLLTSYAFTSVLSRIFEASTTLLIALTFTSNLVAISLYSLAVVGLSVKAEHFMHFLARRFKSRLLLLAVAILQQRIASIIFLVLLISFNAGRIRCWAWWAYATTFCVMVLCTVWLKASLYLYQRAFRTDWLMALASTQENIRFQFEKTMHGVSVVGQMLFPVFIGAMATSLDVVHVCHVLIFLSIGGLLVEPSLIYKLFTTCYALYLPRNVLALDFVDYGDANDLRTIVGIWQAHGSNAPGSSPATSAAAAAVAQNVMSFRALRRYSPVSARPLSRVYKYVRRKPVPVAITFGTLLITSASLIMIGPTTSWFLLAQGMSPVMVSVFRMLQMLITLHPAIPARQSFILMAGGTLACLPLLFISLHSKTFPLVWTYLFAVSILVARAGSPTISLVGDEFVRNYLADEDVLNVYKENAVWLRTNCEMAVQVLTLIWPYRQQFFWPIALSALLTFGGICMVLTLIRKNWASIR